MTHSMLFISDQEKEQLVQIRLMTDRISYALDNLSPEVKEFLKSQIELFKNQADSFSDILQAL
jgi:hypothetical protein